MATIWKLSFTGKSEGLYEAAERLDAEEIRGLLSWAIFDEDSDPTGVLELLFDDAPDVDTVRQMAGLDDGYDARCILLPEEDWVALSQSGLPPVMAGRFSLYGSHDDVPEDTIAILIEAGGADVVLDMVGGSYVQKNVNLARAGARLVSIAFLQGSRVELDMMRVMLKRLTLTGSTLRARPVAEKARLAAAIHKTVWPWIEQGKVRPVIDARFALSDVRQAHERLDSGAHSGKILLIP